jgi:maleylacetoacetate isomerase
MSGQLQLYSYWRSSAAYRVRIGLNLKGLDYETLPVHLVRDGGEQHGDAFRRANPQGLVPVLKHGDRLLRQSLAILEYLDDAWPENPLLPRDPYERQRARAIALAIACDVHPLNNLRVLQYLNRDLAVATDKKDAWIQHWIRIGFDALESMLAQDPMTGRHCIGDTPGIADCSLVPQVYNARRFDVDLAPYPTIVRIEQACLALPAFDAASPENQPDRPPE